MCSTTAGVSAMKTGTELYMSLYVRASAGARARASFVTGALSVISRSYPEKPVADSQLRLGNIVPDFKAETTQGPIESFHEWKKDKWAVRPRARAHRLTRRRV